MKKTDEIQIEELISHCNLSPSGQHKWDDDICVHCRLVDDVGYRDWENTTQKNLNKT